MIIKIDGLNYFRMIFHIAIQKNITFALNNKQGVLWFVYQNMT